MILVSSLGDRHEDRNPYFICSSILEAINKIQDMHKGYYLDFSTEHTDYNQQAIQIGVWENDFSLIPSNEENEFEGMFLLEWFDETGPTKDKWWNRKV